MRDIDLIVVLTQTDGEYDDEVKQGGAAQAEKYRGRQVTVAEIGFTKDGIGGQIRAAGLPANPRIGVYVVSHAFSGIFGGYYIQGVNPDRLAGFISDLLEPITSPQSHPDLKKVVLMGCSLGGDGVNDKDITAENGSYLQRFCFCLRTDNLEPKVAGFDSFVTILRSGEHGGRKSLTPGTDPKPMKHKSRKTHKKFYVRRVGGIVSLTLAEWSDKPEWQG